MNSESRLDTLGKGVPVATLVYDDREDKAGFNLRGRVVPYYQNTDKNRGGHRCHLDNWTIQRNGPKWISVCAPLSLSAVG